MAEDPQPMTLQQRIAALNSAHIGRSPADLQTLPGRPKPHVPDRRPLIKQKSFNIPNEATISTIVPTVSNTPSGPPPLPSRKQPPPLPARRNLQDNVVQDRDPSPRHDYVGTRITASRTKSEENGTDASRIKAPAWGEVELPPLPVKVEPKTRQKSFVDRPRPTTRTPSVSSIASSATTATNVSSISKQSLPPPLPTRKSSNESTQLKSSRNVPPLPCPESLEKARKASFASNAGASREVMPAATPPLPARRPSASPANIANGLIDSLSLNNKAPPVPTLSRPDLNALQATKPRPNNHAASTQNVVGRECMTCRDFSGPDNHAANFPRQRVTSLQDLAYQLTAPFSSHTDKARAIFTWLHHNIDYNVRDFFGGNVRGSTPQSTLQTGLAVCEGYAALFTNLATYAGLESRVIGGHGKGFGYSPLATGAPIPPYEAGHAWNVVKIDNDEWKLIDACWGAGHVQGAGMPYVRKFAPERFTQSNEEFGIDHFPGSRNDFFLPGGRTMSWEEYIQINPASWPYPFERPTIFGNATTDYSIGKQTVMPPNRKINVHQGNTIRFSFGLFCSHWSLERHTQKGPPPVFILAVGGVDGRDKHFLPFEHFPSTSQNGGGEMWYVDVPASELGAPGETLTCFAVTTFGSRKDARGLSVQEFKNGIGRTAMGFVGIAAWDLV